MRQQRWISLATVSLKAAAKLGEFRIGIAGQTLLHKRPLWHLADVQSWNCSKKLMGFTADFLNHPQGIELKHRSMTAPTNFPLSNVSLKANRWANPTELHLATAQTCQQWNLDMGM